MNNFYLEKNIFFVLLLFNFTVVSVFAQKEKFISINDTLKAEPLDPLRPAKAAFYSAIVPGLGQVYNKQYWKVPLVYGAIGTSFYFYLDSKKKYNIYRDEYKNRLKVGESESIYLKLSNDQLIQMQNLYKRNADLSTFFIIGFYVLNIVDANVAAALSQFNVNEKLTLNPKIETIKDNSITSLGLQAVYSF